MLNIRFSKDYEMELMTRYDRRASFYGKATVRYQDYNKSFALYSYNTKVCEVFPETEEALIHGHYSNTTARHIREFLKQCFEDSYIEPTSYNGLYIRDGYRLITREELNEEQRKLEEKMKKEEERERKEEELFSKQYDKFIKLYEKKTNFSLSYSEKLVEELMDFYNKEEILKYIEEMSLSDFKKEVLENCYKILDEYGTKIMKKTIKESMRCVLIDVCGLEYYNIFNDVKMILENY